MNDIFGVQVANGENDLNGVKLDDFFVKPFLGLVNFVELTATDKRHDEVEALRRLEQVVHAHQHGVITREQDIFLQLRVLHLVILNQHILSNGLDRVQLPRFLQLGQEHLAEGAPAQQHFQLEILILHIFVRFEAVAHQHGLAHIHFALVHVELVGVLVAFLIEVRG